MKISIGLVFVFVVAGCSVANTASPQVLARTPGNVVILAGAQSHIQDVMTAVQNECQRQGPRNAVQRSALLIGDSTSGNVRFTFECIREQQ